MTAPMGLDQIASAAYDLASWRGRIDLHAGETELLEIAEALFAEVIRLREEKT